ncbi:MAG: c-type cytochrome [Gemmatimonadota bacterium]|nr:c-type cytochrome [Gemmatimonadota bacterium]MDH5760623.1 c-type cytochrome [Gemmatimonadota bacterium]
MSKETNRVLGHADESDGIEEYDNPLPDWWLGLFWFTIIWAFGYGIHYHFIANRSQESELAAEMAAADARWPTQAEAMAAALSEFAVTAEAVTAGEAIFTQYCVACHSADLSGGIGPSFLDEEWVHGGQAADILRTITEGVPDKGMVPWGGILSPEQINQVGAYVMSKHSEATGRSIEDIVAAGAPSA